MAPVGPPRLEVHEAQDTTDDGDPTSYHAQRFSQQRIGRPIGVQPNVERRGQHVESILLQQRRVGSIHRLLKLREPREDGLVPLLLALALGSRDLLGATVGVGLLQPVRWRVGVVGALDVVASHVLQPPALLVGVRGRRCPPHTGIAAHVPVAWGPRWHRGRLCV